METVKRKKKRKYIKWVIILLVIIAVIVLVLHNLAHSGIQILTNDRTYGRVKRQNLISYVNVSGNVASSNTINIAGRTDLKVSLLNVKVGDSVKKGDVLCEFDKTSLQEEYDTLEASSEKSRGADDYTHSINQRNLEKAKSDKADSLEKAQQVINSAESKRDKAYNDYNSKIDEYNRTNAEADSVYNEMINAEDEMTAEQKSIQWQELKAKAEALKSSLDLLGEQLSVYDDAVSAAYDAYRETEKTADSVIQSAQDTIDAEKYTGSDNSAASQLKKLQEQIDGCTITAPQDGVVTQLNISEGSIPLSSNIIVLENTKELIISGKVNEADILKVSEGMNVEIKTSATNDRIIDGKVKRIERIISSNSEAATGGYTVEISIDDSESGLLIGMSASAKIILDRQDNALSVPYDAVIGGEEDGYFVYLAEPLGENKYKLHKKSVTIGFEGDYYTEITSGELKEGDVVLTAATAISDGDVIVLDVSEE